MPNETITILYVIMQMMSVETNSSALILRSAEYS